LAVAYYDYGMYLRNSMKISLRGRVWGTVHFSPWNNALILKLRKRVQRHLREIFISVFNGKVDSYHTDDYHQLIEESPLVF
jgi:hypothetical protein